MRRVNTGTSFSHSPTSPRLGGDPGMRTEPEAGRCLAGDGGLPPELAERFAVLDVLGRGGMGEVHRVLDRSLGREVALKRVLGARPELATYVVREARALARLEHENVVRIYEAGCAGNQVYLVLELVRGVTLSELIAGGRPPLATAVAIGRDAARGLALAHAAGVVHRDFKPSNVFLDESNRAKVADFGLAEPAAALDAAPYEPGAGGPGLEGWGANDCTLRAANGTPGYMAPEHMRGEAPGPAADVYALGVVLHELLTGRRLFSGSDISALYAAQRAGPPPPPSEANPSVPPALDQLVTRCLDPRAGGRPAAAAVADALAAWLDGVPAARRAQPALPLPPRPYKALAHFEASDAAVHFGRDAEVFELVSWLEGGATLVSVFGPCGAGKSSLIRAGLVPALDPARFAPRVVVPGPDAARGLAAALAAPAPSNAVRVLMLDQLEEVFTQNPAGSKRPAALFRAIEELVQGPAQVRVVLSYRSEFKAGFLPLEERLGAQARSLPLGRMPLCGLVEAIEGPSRLRGFAFAFEPGLSERLAADVLKADPERRAEPLPLAQLCCRHLHEAMEATGSRVITADLYERVLGGARGMLERYVTGRLASPEYAYRGTLARQLLKLLTVRGGAERFACALPEEEAVAFPDRDAARRTLERLISDQLVVRDVAPDGTHRVRLASEVICAVVERWAGEPDDAERAARLLGRGHRQWTEAGRKDEGLLGRDALALVSGQLGALRGLGPEVLAYLERSRAAERRRRWRIAASAGAVLCAVLLALWAGHRPGRVRIASEPPGAEVRYRGRVLGTTPFTWETRPGRHRLDLSRAPHEPVSLEVHVAAGGESSYQPVLAYPFGVLTLAGEPASAHCEIRPAAGGPPLSVRTTPFTTELPTGDYRVIMFATGHVTRTLAPLKLGRNREPRELAVRLERDGGDLQVNGPWTGTRIQLVPESGGPPTSAAVPMLVPVALSTGRYRAVVEGPEHHPHALSVEITRGATTSLTAWTPVNRPRWQTSCGPLGNIEDGAVGAGLPRSPSLVDVDGDGAPEVAVPLARRALALLDATTGRERWRADLSVVATGRAAVAELDAAPGADLAVLCVDGRLRTFHGATGRPLWTLETGAAATADPVAADLDRDGRPELIAALADGTLLAVAADATVRWRHRVAAGPATPQVADTDGDGTPELLLACADGTVQCVSAAGTPRWSASTGAAVAGPPAAADLDGDGLADLAVPTAAREVVALSGRTGERLWTARTDQRPAGVVAADLDGDRHADLVVTVAERLVALAGRDGRRLWNASLDHPVIAPPALFDLDSDRMPDLVTCGGDGVVRTTSGRDGRALHVRPTLGLALAGTPVVADLDRDGTAEVVVHALHDQVAAYSLAPDKTVWAFQTRFTDSPREGWTAVADLDRDDFPDVVACKGDGVVYGLSGRDGRRLWEHATGAQLPLPPAVADVDGDGRTEPLLITLAGSVRALDPRTGRETYRLDLGRPCGSPGVAADLDGDGAPDLVAACDARISAVSIARRRVIWQHDILPPGQLPRSTDLAGWQEGRPGLIAVCPAGTGAPPDLAVTLATGEVLKLSGRDGRRIWKAPGGLYQALPTCPDLDGDGAADPVALDVAGRLVALSGTDGRALWAVTVPGGSDAVPTCGDLDGDGQSEVVLASPDRTLRAFTPAGRPLWQRQTRDVLGQIQLADLDGDGLADVLGAAEGGPRGFSGRDGRPLFALPTDWMSVYSLKILVPKAPRDALYLLSTRQERTEVLVRLPWPVWPAR